MPPEPRTWIVALVTWSGLVAFALTLAFGWFEANGPRRLVPVSIAGVAVSFGLCLGGIFAIKLRVRRATGTWWLPGQREGMREDFRDDLRIRPRFGRRLVVGTLVGFVALSIPILLFCRCNH
jgi:hypothetical protein